MAEMERHSAESAQVGSGNLWVSRGLTTNLTSEQETGDRGTQVLRAAPAHHQLSTTLSPLSQQTPAEASQGRGLGRSSGEGHAKVWPLLQELGVWRSDGHVHAIQGWRVKRPREAPCVPI